MDGKAKAVDYGRAETTVNHALEILCPICSSTSRMESTGTISDRGSGLEGNFQEVWAPSSICSHEG